MASRVAAWTESVGLFLALYGGFPLVGLAFDRLLGVPAFPTAVRLLGFLPLVLGGAGVLWCFGLFVQVGRGTPNPWRPPQILITTGPFALTRNPIILSHALALLGEAFVVGSPLMAVLVLLSGIPVQGVVRLEERTLEDRYGETYRRYRDSVPRWIPRVRRQRR